MVRRAAVAVAAVVVLAAVGGAVVVAGDADVDGLGGTAELRAGTDPTDADSDGDGLDDGRERAGPTDPTDADTDGDRLQDDWELRNRTDDGVALPDADPGRMDVYVVVGVASGVSGLEEYTALEDEFAEMPVENPDGTTGIELHVVEVRQLDAAVTLEDRSVGGRDTSALDPIERLHAIPLLGERHGVYRVVLFVDFYQPLGTAQGWGEVDGDLSVVDGHLDERTKRDVVVHELLHNVVGEIRADDRCPDDPAHYCGRGWLNATVDPADRFLPDPVADELEEEGLQRAGDG